jgi:glycosyltransferase involved in cell wall biosynthesis
MEKDALRVVLATPFGKGGKGGIDRLTDLIVNAAKGRTDPRVEPARLVTRGAGSLFAGAFVFARALVRFSVVVWQGRVDLLHINLASQGSAYRKIILAFLSWRLGVPYIVHLHSGRFDRFWASAPAKIAAGIDWMFIHSDAIVVLGDHWARVVSGRLPQVRAKLHVLPNGTPAVDRSTRMSQPKVNIAFLGKLGENKGTPQLIQALAHLADRKDWSATIAGNGAVAESRTLAGQLGISERIHFPGWIDAAGSHELLRRSDIFVLPSFSEGLPMAILEAFAWGVPVVATPVGSIPEIIDHESNGLLVPAGDVDALERALRRLVQDVGLRERLGEAAARVHAERYDMAVYIARLMEIWNEVSRNRASLQRTPTP